MDNGHCKACESDVDITEIIKCSDCGTEFHAVNCSDEKFEVAAPSTFKKQLHPALLGAGKKKRAGQFSWRCNGCCTVLETSNAMAQVDRIGFLERKMDIMQETFMTQLCELKAAILGSTTPPTVPQPSLSPNNVWSNKQRTSQLRHTMVIKNDNESPVDNSLLEKTCVENGISVCRTFKFNKSSDTGIVLNTKSDADKFIKKMADNLPKHKVDLVPAMKPTVNVVGLARKYTEEEIRDMMVKQNPGVTSVFESDSAEDKYMDVMAVTELRTRPGYFKATVRVSNLIRSVIQKQSDRLYMGSQQTCKVYDNLYVLRCYKCQGFGHHSERCTNDSRCGYCAADHETRDCDKRTEEAAKCCVNCKSAGLPELKHEANSLQCQSLIEQQTKLKKKIPFYQKNQ